MPRFKGSRFLKARATPDTIRAYLLDIGFPPDDIDKVDAEAYADELATVEDILPTLVKAYPFLAPYVYEYSEEATEEEHFQRELEEHLRRILDKLFSGAYSPEEEELIYEELKTLDPITALLNIWASEVVPATTVFKWIEEFGVDPEELPPVMRREYERWKKQKEHAKKLVERIEKREKPRLLAPTRPLIHEAVERVARLAREKKELFLEDVTPVISRLPVMLTKRDIKHYLPAILVSGRPDYLEELSAMYEEDEEVRKWVNDFVAALEVLERLSKGEPVDPSDVAFAKQYFPYSADKYLELKYASKFVERTQEAPATRPYVPREEAVRVRPRVERRRFVFEGINVGEVTVGGGLYVEPEVLEDVERRYTVKKYGVELTEKAVEYVKQRYPFLNEGSPQFWMTVRAKIEEYKRFGRFLL